VSITLKLASNQAAGEVSTSRDGYSLGLGMNLTGASVSCEASNHGDYN